MPDFRLVKLQPASHTDHITADGTELQQLPYPFFVTPAGHIEKQDLWQGRPYRVVGFVSDLASQRVDLWWLAAAEDPQQAVGMYIVTIDVGGRIATRLTAVSSVEVLR